LITDLPVASPARCNARWIFNPFPQTVPNQLLTLARPWVLPCQQGAIGFSPLPGAAQNQDFLGVLFGDANGSFAPASGGGAAGPVRDSRKRLAAPRRGPHRSLRLPILVDGDDPWQAAELLLYYDARWLRPRGVRRPAGNPAAMLEYNLRQPGVVRIAMARLEPHSNVGIAPLLVLFDEVGATQRNLPARIGWSQVEG
jgi:hypothetical protein